MLGLHGMLQILLVRYLHSLNKWFGIGLEWIAFDFYEEKYLYVEANLGSGNNPDKVCFYFTLIET